MAGLRLPYCLAELRYGAFEDMFTWASEVGVSCRVVSCRGFLCRVGVIPHAGFLLCTSVRLMLFNFFFCSPAQSAGLLWDGINGSSAFVGGPVWDSAQFCIRVAAWQQGRSI